MLQAVTGVSKIEKAQRNLCQTSPSKIRATKPTKQIADKNERSEKSS
jgi:hypothetical protein